MVRNRIQRGSVALSSKVVRSVSSLYLALAVAGLSWDANAVEDAVATTYALSFSDMRVSHHVNQDEPRPDLYVHVRRLDAEWRRDSMPRTAGNANCEADKGHSSARTARWRGVRVPVRR